jgi:hypothetical protein
MTSGSPTVTATSRRAAFARLDRERDARRAAEAALPAWFATWKRSRLLSRDYRDAAADRATPQQRARILRDWLTEQVVLGRAPKRIARDVLGLHVRVVQDGGGLPLHVCMLDLLRIARMMPVGARESFGAVFLERERVVERVAGAIRARVRPSERAHARNTQRTSDPDLLAVDVLVALGWPAKRARNAFAKLPAAISLPTRGKAILPKR